MRHKSTKWYFFKHPAYFLGRVCFDSHTFPKLEMGIVRGFRFERRKTKRPRYWVWVDCIDRGLPVSLRFSDDEVGYLDLGIERELSLEAIIEILNDTLIHVEATEEFLGNKSDEYKEALSNYESLIVDLPHILVQNGHFGAWSYNFVLSQHYLMTVAWGQRQR